MRRYDGKKKDREAEKKPKKEEGRLFPMTLTVPTGEGTLNFAVDYTPGDPRYESDTYSDGVTSQGPSIGDEKAFKSEGDEAEAPVIPLQHNFSDKVERCKSGNFSFDFSN